MAGLTQFFVELLLSVSRVRRYDDLQLHILIASAPGALVKTLTSQSQPLTTLSAGWYLYFYLSFECWYFDSRPQYGF